MSDSSTSQHIMFKIDKHPSIHPNLLSKVKHSTNKGRWNKKEHIMFLHGIVKYGNNWKKIKELIKTRSNAQARSHGQKFFIKLKENKKFSFGPFVNIKHFFHKIKGYTHLQKQMLLQELKRVPFDSEDLSEEINMYNEEDMENDMKIKKGENEQQWNGEISQLQYNWNWDRNREMNMEQQLQINNRNNYNLLLYSLIMSNYLLFNQQLLMNLSGQI